MDAHEGRAILVRRGPRFVECSSGCGCRLDSTQSCRCRFVSDGLYERGIRGSTGPEHRSAPGLTVEEIDLQDLDRLHGFSVALSDGFGIPSDIIETTQKAVQIEYAAPGWHVYLASIEGCQAGMATLYADGTVASIDAMATVPCYRRRGCQTALLQRCIADAARAGCELLASQTLSGSTSERNMARAGFRVAYTKALYSERSGVPG